MIKDVAKIEVDHLLTTVQSLSDKHYRLVSITGIDAGDHFELLYHFDRDLHLIHLRVNLPKECELPSIGRIYYCAFVPENELQDMFGIKVMNPVVDYRGHMLLAQGAPAHPLRKEPPQEEVAR